ncbi:MULTISPECIES: NADPH-dependent FMN reductase [Paenibacillus]|uniref:NADPH-dependent FMN reductase n=2 Tax=Paenibacillus lactis TaxID=228574 RepID=G4HAT5_9BACL|nr:NADPH-dependent FMN reductase [Paenibacillus lactis]EHB67044.1 NADPH-dependent FMN reductase [Paenibacillus lactis 154]MBP1895718.1 NAD(P)H-dependent FMN reductase [Paenibacillus lactis]MCM3496850.1 NAD(P)H-dependent oxidoreductase [Paenibacillus lactis]GIO93675.1 NADPH-dependent FMN reductase [Paenibacillus lactis]HAG00573.1 NADPH-dependent oxidoreductase [Paenibacillus lactis]
MKIVIIAGSNRKEATSTILAKALQAQMNLGSVETELFNLYETPLPFYSPDEIFNRHEGVRELQRLLMEADGIILTTPEYHGGMSGVLKNALDHMGQMHFSGKPVLSVSSAGGAVGVSSLQQMQATVRNLHGINSPEWISIGGSQRNLYESEAAEGTIVLDYRAKEALAIFMELVKKISSKEEVEAL